jgi:hypothetical protein
MATLEYGISHTDTCSNNKTKTQKQSNEIMGKYFFQNTVRLTQKEFDKVHKLYKANTTIGEKPFAHILYHSLTFEFLKRVKGVSI